VGGLVPDDVVDQLVQLQVHLVPRRRNHWFQPGSRLVGGCVCIIVCWAAAAAVDVEISNLPATAVHVKITAVVMAGGYLQQLTQVPQELAVAAVQLVHLCPLTLQLMGVIRPL